jgi:hypothetical protein
LERNSTAARVQRVLHSSLLSLHCGLGGRAHLEDRYAAGELRRPLLEEGIVPGGGIALLRAQRALDGLEESLPEDARASVTIVRRGIEEPQRWIAGNAGLERSIVVEKVKQGRGAFGFNAATEVY